MNRQDLLENLNFSRFNRILVHANQFCPLNIGINLHIIRISIDILYLLLEISLNIEQYRSNTRPNPLDGSTSLVTTNQSQGTKKVMIMLKLVSVLECLWFDLWLN